MSSFSELKDPEVGLFLLLLSSLLQSHDTSFLTTVYCSLPCIFHLPPPLIYPRPNPVFSSPSLSISSLFFLFLANQVLPSDYSAVLLFTSLPLLKLHFFILYPSIHPSLPFPSHLFLLLSCFPSFLPRPLFFLTTQCYINYISGY